MEEDIGCFEFPGSVSSFLLTQWLTGNISCLEQKRDLEQNDGRLHSEFFVLSVSGLFRFVRVREWSGGGWVGRIPSPVAFSALC